MKILALLCNSAEKSEYKLYAQILSHLKSFGVQNLSLFVPWYRLVTKGIYFPFPCSMIPVFVGWRLTTNHRPRS